MANLETLEDRTLLSNVVTSFAHDAITGANTLNIKGDTHNDSFSVTENYSNGFVTLVGTGSPVKTQINSLPVGTAYTTSRAIADIVVTLPGSGLDSDVVSMGAIGTGHGTGQNVTITVPGASTTSGGTNLTLNVNGLKNSGYFTLIDAPYSTATGAVNYPFA